MTDTLFPDVGQPFPGGVPTREACTRQALDSLGGDAALLAMLVPEFALAARRQTEALASALAQVDRTQMRHWAHTLRGSLLTLGAADTGALAGAIETHALDASPEVLGAAIERLIAETRHLVTQLSGA